MQRGLIVIEGDRPLFVDCDDTLVMWKGENYVPHLKHIEMVKRFHKRGLPVIVWSAGGYEWALRIVKELYLENYVTAVMAKPMWYIDDLKVESFMPEVNRIYIMPPGEEK